jgi:hypothetical protein
MKTHPVIVAPTVKLSVNVPKNTSIVTSGAELLTIFPKRVAHLG